MGNGAYLNSDPNSLCLRRGLFSLFSSPKLSFDHGITRDRLLRQTPSLELHLDMLLWTPLCLGELTLTTGK